MQRKREMASVSATTGNWNKLLNNKVALITGAGGAIGRQIAITFVQHGAKVSLSDINQQMLNETVSIIHEQIHDRTSDCIPQCIDVSKENEVEEWIQSTHKRWNSIDILVNNAAKFIFGEIDEVTDDQWNTILASNVKGYALCAKHTVRIMKQQRSGVILNIASISSIISQPKFVPYNVTKAAVLQMSKNIAHDVGEYGIRCNAIGPGNIETPATRKHAESLGMKYEDLIEQNLRDHFVKYMGQPSDISNAAVFICSDLSRFTTGALWMIDGGYSTH